MSRIFIRKQGEVVADKREASGEKNLHECKDGERGGSLACLQLADFVVDEATIPETLPEVPTETGEAIEESELEEVVDTIISGSTEVTNSKK